MLFFTKKVVVAAFLASGPLDGVCACWHKKTAGMNPAVS